MLNTLHSCQNRSGKRTAADWLIGARCYITGWLLFRGVQGQSIFIRQMQNYNFFRRYCVLQQALIKLIRQSHDRGAWVFSFNLQVSQPDFKTLDFNWKVVSRREEEVAAQCHLLSVTYCAQSVCCAGFYGDFFVGKERKFSQVFRPMSFTTDSSRYLKK